MQASTAQLNEIVQKTVEGLGFEFVELERLPRNLLRVTIDVLDGGSVTVDDCQTVSDQLSAVLTVENVDYDRLEVSSPGVDRPLKRLKDFVRFVGVPVHVELYEPLHAEGFPEAGRRKLEGRILSVEGEPGSEIVRFSFEELEIARTPAQAVKMRQSRKKSQSDAKPIEVAFAFQDVDRANLIPQLDFRGNKQ